MFSLRQDEDFGITEAWRHLKYLKHSMTYHALRFFEDTYLQHRSNRN